MSPRSETAGPSLADLILGNTGPHACSWTALGGGDPAGRPGGGRASVSWRLLFVFAEAEAAKTTRNCWEVSESGLVRTVLPSQRALGSQSGSPHSRAPPLPSGRRPRSRPPQSRLTPPPLPGLVLPQNRCSRPTQALASRGPPPPLSAQGRWEAWSLEYWLCEPAVWEVPARG